MYALALPYEKRRKRYLVSISYNNICFNVGKKNFMPFETIREIEIFRRKWASHFYDMNHLVVVKNPEDED